MSQQALERINKNIEVYNSYNRGDIDLTSKNINKVTHLLNDFDMQNLLMKISDPDYIKNFNYTNLADLNDKLDFLSTTLKEAKEEIDLDKFFKNGEIFNFKKLRKKFKDQNLKRRYPNFNFDRYEELFKTPILEINNYAGETIIYDKYLVSKLMIGVNQMVFDEMDFYYISVGKEGGGKSCFSSQLLLWFFTYLKEIGLIEYAYDVKKLFFSSIRSVLEDQDTQKENEYFKLMTLDEAYELNRMNFREEASKEFKDDMRSSRKMQRIVGLNLPQIGELETAITLTRANMIFYTDMDSNPETGTLNKGEVSMYILPRGKFIYSPYQKRNISDKEITDSLNKVMRDKNDAYKGFPKNCLINKLRFKGVWGFDKQVYDKHIKTENKKKRLKGTIKMTDYVGYIMFKYLPALKNWGFDMKNPREKKMYGTMQKFLKTQVEYRYLMNPEIRAKFENMLDTAVQR